MLPMRFISFLGLTFFLSGYINLSAQTMKDCLQRMPESMFPFLTATNLADMPDFIQSGMQAKVKNRFSETSEMKVMTDDFAEIKLGDLTSVQMKLLPMKDGGKRIVWITTVEVPEKDSRLRLFTTEWEELSAADYFKWPAIDSFALRGDSLQSDADQERVKYENTLRILREVPLFYIRLDAAHTYLDVSWSGIERLSEAERAEIEPYLRKEAYRFRWNGDVFERME